MNDSLDGLIRIVLIDSQTLVRTGLRLIVDSHPGMKVVGEAGDSAEAADITSCLKPDIILLNLDPGGNIGLEIIQGLQKASNQCRVILLSRSDENQVHLSAVKVGALGIVMKTQSQEVLIKAIQKVHAGEVWIERSLIANLLSGLTHTQSHASQDPDAERIAQLSARERNVIQLLGRGFKNQQIAKNLCLSETTVRHHLTSIYSKLGVTDRLELLVFAHRFGLD